MIACLRPAIVYQPERECIMIKIRTMLDSKCFHALISVTLIFGFQNVHGAEPITVPALPYAENALEPVITAKTVNLHYGKHHKGYADNLNRLIKGTPYETQSLDEIMKNTAGKSNTASIFNNAAQVWNHTFYWQSIRPETGKKMPDLIKSMIDSSFGSYDAFRKAFAEAATTQFGSGWAWLVKDGKTLKIIKTGNAENPLSQGLVPLLTIDVWEHAYYLDYQNKRGEYVNILIDKMLNWDFALKNLSSKPVSVQDK